MRSFYRCVVVLVFALAFGCGGAPGTGGKPGGSAAPAQDQATTQDQATAAAVALMDKMTGQWLVTGTIHNEATTHDVDVDWVLKRQYIRIHEVSPDKAAEDGIGYEAWIYLVWDAKQGEYKLDPTAKPKAIDLVEPNGSRNTPGIYELDGDTLKICIAEGQNAVRPTAFKPDGMRMPVVTFKRVTEAKKDK